MKANVLGLLTVTLLAGQMAANAELVPVEGGTLVSDTTQNLTWVSDANLFLTKAQEDPNLVNAIVSNAAGLFVGYTVSAEEFITTGTYAGTMTWWAAEAWVHYLNVMNYEGYSNWRLPTTVRSLNSLGYPDGIGTNPSPSSSEMAHLFYTDLGQVAGSFVGSNPGPFRNVQGSDSNSTYWSGTNLEPYNAFLFIPFNGYQGNSFSLNGISYAWPVRDGHVVTIADRLALLLAESTGVGPGRSLADKVALAQTYYAVPDIQATCAVLIDFGNEVLAQRGKKLTPEFADELTADAQAIMTVIVCN
jgi:hypothetical protein